MNQNKGVYGLNVLNVFNSQEIIKDCLEAMTKYQPHANIDKVFKAEDISDAHNFIEQRKSKGKVLLQWN